MNWGIPLNEVVTMGSALAASALKSYRQTGTAAVSLGASPQRLIGMLYDSALGRLAAARGCLERGDVGGRHSHVTRVLDILQYLQQTLNPEAGGALADQLGQLYDYMQRQLTLANARADAAGLDEVAALLRTLKDAWDGLPAQ
jgi:flagellar secretion chaperone FliS